MTNFEKYKNEIEKIILTGERIAINKEKNHVCGCNSIVCSMCAFNVLEKTCVETRKKWLNAEYQESEIDWSKVPRGTHVWVRNCKGEKWSPRLFMGLNDENFDISPYIASSLDLWVSEHETDSFWMGIKFRYCKLDDSVDPTPYLKKVGE